MCLRDISARVWVEEVHFLHVWSIISRDGFVSITIAQQLVAVWRPAQALIWVT